MLMINEATAGSLLDLAGVRECVRAALEQQAMDRVEQSDPRSQFLKSEEHNNRYHIKGAYLRDDLVAGFRVREFTHVPVRSDEMQLILLSDLKTAAFLGVVSCDQISERRFGAMAALTIEALRKQNSSTLAVVGAGALAPCRHRGNSGGGPFCKHPGSVPLAREPPSAVRFPVRKGYCRDRTGR